MSVAAIVVSLWGHSCLPQLKHCQEDVKQADFNGIFAFEKLRTS